MKPLDIYKWRNDRNNLQSLKLTPEITPGYKGKFHLPGPKRLPALVEQHAAMALPLSSKSSWSWCISNLERRNTKMNRWDPPIVTKIIPYIFTYSSLIIPASDIPPIEKLFEDGVVEKPWKTIPIFHSIIGSSSGSSLGFEALDNLRRYVGKLPKTPKPELVSSLGGGFTS